MSNRINRIMLMLVLLLLGMALAAQAVEPNWDFRSWAGNTVTFAGGVAAVTALLRRYVLKSLDGPAVRFVAIGVGVVLGAGLGLVPGDWGFPSLLEGAWNGLMAGAVSFLGVDALRDIALGQGTSGSDSSGNG